MTKLNNLKVGMLAIAMVLSTAVLRAQAVSGPATGKQMTQSKTPAASELANFKADPSNQELSDLRLALLKAKAELESGQAANTLSAEQISHLTRRIGLTEAKVNAMSSSNNSSSQVNDREKLLKDYNNSQAILKGSTAITREQFMSLDASSQKQVLINNEIKISDLVNGTPEMLRSRQENKFYIPVDNFSSYATDKQIHILNNPADYILVQNASQIPVNTTVKQDPEITTNKITRAELNSYSPERRKAIEESNNFVITD